MMDKFLFLNAGVLVDDDLELVLLAQYPGDTAKSRVPGYEFEMRGSQTGRVMGHIRFRVGDIDGVLKYGCHVGYDVNEEFRGHKYAARSLRLLLPLARAHGLRELWIGCDPTNVASRRTCEVAGASFRDVLDIPETHEMHKAGWSKACRYAIEL